VEPPTHEYVSLEFEERSVRVLVNKWIGVVVYLVSVAGMSVLTVDLSYHMARQAIALALPYFPEPGPRQISLVERRQIDAEQASKPLSRVEEVVLTVPAIPPQILAAQLDLAEKEDAADTQPAPRRVRNSTRRRAPHVSLSAADEFARSFGILTVASR
jgi:hypothetical protein